MTQTQFNLTEGRLRKEEGMDRVSEHANEEWKAEFRKIGRWMAAGHKSFTSEDVVQLVGTPPNSHNAVGAAMNSLARELKLTKVGYRPAKRPSRHASVVAVWQLK